MKTNCRGFLLAEAVFSIFITLIVVLTLQGLLKNLKIADEEEHQVDEMAYTYIQFNSFLHNNDGKKYYLDNKYTDFKKAVIRQYERKNEQKTYRIEQYKKMIRVTTIKGGHMPLVLNVDRAKFFAKGNLLKIIITEKDGRVSELYFKLDPKPMKEDDDVKTKKYSAKEIEG